VHEGTIVMRSFIRHYGRDRDNRWGIAGPQHGNLVLAVPQHHAPDRDGSRGNCASPKQTGDKPKGQTAQAAKPVTAATRSPTT
jgi:hypothetical protein